MKYCSVIIESRPLPNLKEIIWDNHLKYIPNDWDLFFIGSESSADVVGKMYKTDCEGHDIYKWKDRVVNTSVSYYANSPSYNENFGIKEYNELLTSVSFWLNFLQYDRVLIFQHDSKILREGIMEFATADYDYIGSPWKFQMHGGNGGISIRNPRAMYKMCQDFKYEYPKDPNEDVWFSNVLHNNPQYGNLASRDECLKFGCETIFKLGTLCCHSPEKYLTEEECKMVYNQYERN